VQELICAGSNSAIFLVQITNLIASQQNNENKRKEKKRKEKKRKEKKVRIRYLRENGEPGRLVHKIKSKYIIDTKGLELQNYVRQIAALNLWNSCVFQLCE
jgi:hypothetical protein